ncbi:hypothetical protein [Syntrophus aciditrophicus]|nr:hypothetical protein [Syntrophus aciditrophicus]
MKRTKLEIYVFYYGEYLEKLGGYNLAAQLALSDLGSTGDDKAVIQRCYRDLKKEDFDGSIIDYMCWISTQCVLDAVSKHVSEKTPTKYIEFIIEHSSDFWEDTRNLLRLFNKNPVHFFRWFGIKEDAEAYKLLAGYWYKLFMADYNYLLSLKSKS